MYIEDDFLQTEHSMVMATAADMSMQGPLIGNLSRWYGNHDVLFNQRKHAGYTATLPPLVSGKQGQYLFYLLIKNTRWETAQTNELALALLDLRAMVLSLGLDKLAVPVTDTGLDGISWSAMYEMLHILFCATNVQVLAYRYFYTSFLFSTIRCNNTTAKNGPLHNMTTRHSPIRLHIQYWHA
jgi:hypothetical protein